MKGAENNGQINGNHTCDNTNFLSIVESGHF